MTELFNFFGKLSL